MSGADIRRLAGCGEVRWGRCFPDPTMAEASGRLGLLEGSSCLSLDPVSFFWPEERLQGRGWGGGAGGVGEQPKELDA